MATALDRIIAYKKDEVADLKSRRSREDLLAEAKTAGPVRGFAGQLGAAVVSGRNGLICEMKRKSPSAGEILPGADPTKIARDYEQGGAACLSVLTDGPSFGGSLEDFSAIRAAVDLPMLRKDFMIDPIQVIEARAHGADAVLVILSCTDDALARDLIQTATELGMDTLIETHDAKEVDRALRLPPGLLGINNRDLKRMVTDLATTERLSSTVPTDRPFISESGISSEDDIRRLRTAGARRFLIGESLMKRRDRREYCRRLCEAH